MSKTLKPPAYPISTVTWMEKVFVEAVEKNDGSATTAYTENGRVLKFKASFYDETYNLFLTLVSDGQAYTVEEFFSTESPKESRKFIQASHVIPLELGKGVWKARSPSSILALLKAHTKWSKFFKNTEPVFKKL